MPPHDSNDSGGGPPGDIMATYGLLLVAVRALAFPHELVVRRLGTMGNRYPGALPMLGGVFAAGPLWVTFVHPTEGVKWWPVYWLTLLGLAACHRVAQVRRREPIHSRYVGDCWLGNRAWELPIGVALAAGTLTFCPSLAGFVLASALANAVHNGLLEERDRRIVQRMRDQEIEARYYADRFRDE